jgi:hypothetical protein
MGPEALAGFVSEGDGNWSSTSTRMSGPTGEIFTSQHSSGWMLPGFEPSPLWPRRPSPKLSSIVRTNLSPGSAYHQHVLFPSPMRKQARKPPEPAPLRGSKVSRSRSSPGCRS